MTNFALIFLCLLAGQLFRRSRLMPENAAATLNGVVLYLSLPAVVLLQLPAFLGTATLSWAMLAPVAVPWVQLLLAWGFYAWLGRRRRWAPTTIGALIIATGLGNTSFLGFPILEALLGTAGVQVGLLADQLGSFPALSTLGLLLAAKYHGQKVPARVMLRRMTTFPPFLSLLAAAAWAALGAPGHAAASPLLGKLAATLAPLAVLSVGLQLNIHPAALRARVETLGIGLAFKLLAMPALCALVLIGGLGLRGLIAHATVLEIAMPSMVTASVIAAQFKLDEGLASQLVGLGIIASLATLPLWHWLLLDAAGS